MAYRDWGPTMVGHFRRLPSDTFLVIACASVMACSSVTVATTGERVADHGPLTSYERTAYIAVGEVTPPPNGWVEFCVVYKPECETKPSKPRDAILTPKTWSDMAKVNNWVNNHIKPVTDLEHWGVVDQWDIPNDGKGDCEDYVLLKRRMLMQAGWPREALLITVVRDKKGDGHAVLTVKTDRGEFILDNQESQILSWNKTGHRFVMRQSQSDPNVWVMLGEPQIVPTTVAAH